MGVTPTAVTAPSKNPAPLTPIPPLVLMNPLEVDVDTVVSVTDTWPEAKTVPIVKDWLVAVTELVDVSSTAVTAPPKKPVPLAPMPPLDVMNPVEVDAYSVVSVTVRLVVKVVVLLVTCSLLLFPCTKEKVSAEPV